jgi:GNAT superfamily N-acetyltransferase
MLFQIRSMTEADLPAVFSLLEDAQKELSGKYGVSGNSRLAQQHCIKASLGEGKGFALVGLNDEGAIIGWLSWLRDVLTPSMVYGVGTYVHPMYRRHLLGEQMRKRALDWCRENDLSCNGTVAIGNEAGLQSVLKVGFKVVGQVVEWRPKW